MNRKLWSIFVAVVSVMLIASAGCAKKVKHSGFLEDYPEFNKGPIGGVNWVYFKEGVDFTQYNKVMMDHVVFYFSEDAKYKGVNPDELKEMADAFHQAIAEALKGAYPLVEEPGPDVLRIRVAITDIVPSRPALNTISTIIPIGLGISIIKRGITGTHAFVGQASMEAELLDSVTNERLAAAIDTKSAEKYKVIKGLFKWDHAKDAFKYWAKRLRSWLDEVHVKNNN